MNFSALPEVPKVFAQEFLCIYIYIYIYIYICVCVDSGIVHIFF